MLNRRDAIRGLALTIGATSAGLAGSAMAADGLPPLTWTPTALTLDQARLVDVVAELIIPATDTPGARQAGVPQFVDRALADYCDKAQAQLLRTGLDRMDANARTVHGAAFVALTAPQQVALLAGYDREASAVRNQTPKEPHFFLALEDLVTIGYFTSEPGATVALRYDPVPGEYHGCVPLAQLGRAWATR
jgi:gluconate 2-dehydrogenase gamma chain